MDAIFQTLGSSRTNQGPIPRLENRWEIQPIVLEHTRSAKQVQARIIDSQHSKIMAFFIRLRAPEVCQRILDVLEYIK